MFKLHGIYAPIATPFAGGEIAYDKLEKNLDFWLGSDLRESWSWAPTGSSSCFRLRKRKS